MHILKRKLLNIGFVVGTIVCFDGITHERSSVHEFLAGSNVAQTHFKAIFRLDYLLFLSSQFANLSWPIINAAICIYAQRKQDRERESAEREMRFLFGTLLTLFLLLFYLQFLFECKKKLAGELVDRHLSEFVCCPSCHKEGATETDKKRDGKGRSEWQTRSPSTWLRTKQRELNMDFYPL